MDGAFTGRQAHTEAIDRKIVAAQNWYEGYETSAAEAQAGSPEIDWFTCAVGHIDPQEALT